MPTDSHLKSPFFYNNYYHIVFKSVDGLLLFKNEEDYAIFLHRFNFYLGDFLHLWAYCLLNNHVHFIVKIKSAISITKG